MTSEITKLQTAAAVNPGDPDQPRRNPDQHRRPRPAPQAARAKESDDLGYDEHDPAARPRIGLLIDVRG